MQMISKFLFTVLFSCLAVIATSHNSYAEDFFDDPGEEEDDGDFGENLTVVDLAVIALDNQVYGKCECNPDNTAPYEKCANKLRKKAMTAFKPAAKFNQESVPDLKQALAEEIEILVLDCQDQGDDEGDDEEDLPDDEEDF